MRTANSVCFATTPRLFIALRTAGSMEHLSNPLPDRLHGVAWMWLWPPYMATLLMILLVVGYALSVWSLKRQEHFREPPLGLHELPFGLHRRGAAARRRIRKRRRLGGAR